MTIAQVSLSDASQPTVRKGKRNDSPINLVTLLDDLAAYVRQYLRLSSTGDYDIITLWVAHTYAISTVDTTPYLGFLASYGHGKTSALDVLENVVCNPWRATLPTAPVMFRIIEERSPTILIDELDATRDGDPEAAQAIRAVFNSGNRRGAKVPRIRKTKDGTHDDVVDHETFSAKAYATVGTPWPSVATRSIAVDMPWTSRRDLTEYRRSDVETVTTALRTKLAQWVTPEVLTTLSAVRWDVVPDEVEDPRTAQLWTPLVAIADLAGGSWPQRIRAAIVERHGGDNEIRQALEPVQLLDNAVRDAIERGFIRVSGPKSIKDIPPNFGAMSDPTLWGCGGQALFKRVSMWHDTKAHTAELRIAGKEWPRFYGAVRKVTSVEQRSAIPSTAAEALKVLKLAGRLHVSTGHTAKVALYTGGEREQVVRFDITPWCWPNGYTEPEEMP